uniref:Peptidase C1A papain C-terminal domain-containing protein n=1 Tax=Panagrolaimus sp. PS1159 TaxID=55785 RepID=A0AC35GB11_9BILA
MIRLYEKAKKEVDEFNKKYQGATFAINKFSFMSENERKKHLNPSLSIPTSLKFVTFEDENITAPESFDYRKSGKITPVKDQTLSGTSGCGSCFAFAATGAVESQYLLKQNLELDLSEEYLLECDTADAECGGGLENNSLNVYVNNGVPSEACIPYTGTNGKCPDIADTEVCKKYKIGGYKTLGDDEDKYPGMLFKYGPIAIGMNAGAPLQFYHNGVLDIPLKECGDGGHAVLLVGYTKDYWIAKNSWGAKHGENGYFRFKRGVNFCNFAKYDPMIPYLSDPTSVLVS